MRELDASDLARLAFFGDLAACTWAEFNAQTPEARRGMFTMPGVDDIKMIAAAHAAMGRVLSGEKGEWRLTECFMESGGFFARDYFDTLKVAWDFYRVLTFAAAAFPASLDTDVLEAYPADELLRSGRKKEPRDWLSLWKSAGGSLYGKRMIAPARDTVWSKISVMALPFPPFAFSSRMTRASISAREWQRLNGLKS